MIVARMVSYSPGLQTVLLIKAIHEHTGVSLAESKNVVEQLISGEKVVVTFRSSEDLVRFRQVAAELRVQLE